MRFCRTPSTLDYLVQDVSKSSHPTRLSRCSMLANNFNTTPECSRNSERFHLILFCALTQCGTLRNNGLMYCVYRSASRLMFNHGGVWLQPLTWGWIASTCLCPKRLSYFRPSLSEYKHAARSVFKRFFVPTWYRRSILPSIFFYFLRARSYI